MHPLGFAESLRITIESSSAGSTLARDIIASASASLSCSSGLPNALGPAIHSFGTLLSNLTNLGTSHVRTRVEPFSHIPQ